MILANSTPARVAAVATAVPENVVDRADAIRVLSAMFPAEGTARIENMVNRSGVLRRFIVPTLDEVISSRTFSERNTDYHEAAVALASRACATALARSGFVPEDIDVLIDVSCTGVTIPALDVSIAPAIGLRSGVRRIPITESGCAGGALALNVASSLARAGLRVLVVAVEICSLSLVGEDRSRTNLVASVLFGDGAAAAVVAPDGPGPRIEAMHTHLIPGTRDVMGFDVGSHGMRIVLQRELPGIVGGSLPRVLMEFLGANGRCATDIDLHLVHPGGRSILDAYEKSFELQPEDLRFSRAVLGGYGNLSSASILAVLELAMAAHESPEEELEGVLVAIGPGLSMEMALLRWEARA